MKKLLLPLVTTILFASNADYNRFQEEILKLRYQPETAQKEFLLGKLYFDRHLVYADYIKAFNHFKKADNKESFYYLGKMYQDGLGCNQNIQKAVEYYKKSNSPAAKYQLAMIYLYPKSSYLVQRNIEKGMLYLKEAAKDGYAKAQLALGKLYLEDNEIVDKDLNEAAKWINLAAQQDEKDAIIIWNEYKLDRFLNE